MQIKGYFTSYWEGGATIETPATLDTVTMKVETTAVDVDDGECEILIKEEFVSMGGEVYNICPECHEYATTAIQCVDGERNSCPECGLV